MFKITLTSLPPSVNHAYNTVRKGKRVVRFRTKKSLDFIEYVRKECESFIEKPFENDVSVKLHITFGDRRKRDIDNILKILFDSLEGIIWLDDRQVAELYIKREFGDSHKIEIEVKEL